MSPATEATDHVMAFPHALGTGIIITSPTRYAPETRQACERLINDYEAALSRFRADSIVASMRDSRNGGTFAFPDWALGLFDLYDRLYAATAGAVDPCVGADLIRLGYAASFDTPTANAARSINTPHVTDWDSYGKRVAWPDIERHGTTLITHAPVALDFGACGKGYLVDLLSRILSDSDPDSESDCESDSDSSHERTPAAPMAIDAGGDMFVHAASPLSIALENPFDLSQAVGTASICRGALCASAPSRRRWTANDGQLVHHLINALDGIPVRDMAATWAYVPSAPMRGIAQDVAQHGGEGTSRGARQTDVGSIPHSHAEALCDTYPTACADGLATALFVTPAEQLRLYFPFECALLHADGTAAASTHFPGRFFIKQ